mmetsp:Transcript_25439/g.64872  ORF Transcript_25439/g.64872 Transcript_25439/m.64872 type:complete len:206 (+) Transcript_25439:745-1362(+)
MFAKAGVMPIFVKKAFTSFHSKLPGKLKRVNFVPSLDAACTLIVSSCPFSMQPLRLRAICASSSVSNRTWPTNGIDPILLIWACATSPQSTKNCFNDSHSVAFGRPLTSTLVQSFDVSSPSTIIGTPRNITPFLAMAFMAASAVLKRTSPVVSSSSGFATGPSVFFAWPGFGSTWPYSDFALLAVASQTPGCPCFCEALGNKSRF